MSTSSNKSVSTPLLIALAVVVVAGAVYYFFFSSAAAADSGENVPGVLKPPPDYKPMTQEELNKIPGPKPTGGGSGG